MGWKEIICQIIIAFITTSLGSILSYKKAIKDSNNKIEEVRINANRDIDTINLNTENEINKIKEESNSEIARIEAECVAKIKQKKEDFNNEMLTKFLDNPMALQSLINVYNGNKDLFDKK